MEQEPPQAFDPNEAELVSRRNLPHWRQHRAVYFVTFRLADSIPVEKINAWRVERDRWLACHPLAHSQLETRELCGLWDERIEKWLNAGHGSCILREKANQAIVEGALKFFDGKRYELGDYVIVPNHVHLLVAPHAGQELSKILHSWKSFTAHEIGKRSGRPGAVWQEESFDHIVRDDRSLAKFVAYIRENGTGLPQDWAQAGRGKLNI